MGSLNADWGSVTATVGTDKAWSPPPEGSMGQLGTTAARTARGSSVTRGAEELSGLKVFSSLRTGEEAI